MSTTKEGKMAQKSVKKAPAKKVAAAKKVAPVKKTVAAKAPAKKAVAKKVAPKKAAKPEIKPVIVAQEVTHDCGCGKDCHCGHKCGCRAGRFFKKLVIVLIVFALGFAAAKMLGCCKKPMPRFVDGCMDVTSVKCPKLQAELPMMDINGDGCITHEEFDAYKHATTADTPVVEEVVIDETVAE